MNTMWYIMYLNDLFKFTTAFYLFNIYVTYISLRPPDLKIGT